MNPIWSQKSRITTYQIDPFGKLKLPGIFELFQDAASLDAARKGFGYHDMLATQKVWVLIRVLLKVTRLPSWDEHIEFRTWPKDVAAILAFRDFEILDEQGHLLISGTSSWSQIDLKTRRPLRINPDEFQYALPDKHALRDRAGKVGLPTKFNWSPDFEVRNSQIDINWHVNNTRYLEWIYNEIPIEWMRDKSLSEVLVNFLQEGHLNDSLTVGVKKVDDNSYIGCVRRQNDEKVLCSTKLIFQKAEL